MKKVMPMREPIISFTSLENTNEYPKSPRRTIPETHLKYCVYQGWSSPYILVSRSTSAVSTVRPLAFNRLMRSVRKSPGGSWMMMNARMVMMRIWGIMRSKRPTI